MAEPSKVPDGALECVICGEVGGTCGHYASENCVFVNVGHPHPAIPPAVRAELEVIAADADQGATDPRAVARRLRRLLENTP